MSTQQLTDKEAVDKLALLVSELDLRERAQEEKRGLRVNIYRIGHYLGAVNSIREDVLATVPAHRFIDAFKDSFNPTRGLHGVAKKLGLPLDVERGRWIVKEGN